MTIRKLLVPTVVLILLFQTSCKKKVCITCSNINIQTGAATSTVEGCGKTDSEAYKDAESKLPHDTNTVIQCNQ